MPREQRDGKHLTMMTKRLSLEKSSSTEDPTHKPYKKDLPWHQDYIPWLSLTTSHLRESRLLSDALLASVLILLKSSISEGEVGKQSGLWHSNHSPLSCITCVSLSWCNLRPSTPEQVLWSGFIDLMSLCTWVSRTLIWTLWRLGQRISMALWF